jgi:hypothetical protein
MSEPKKEEPKPELKKLLKSLMAKMKRGAELQKELKAIEAELKKYGMSSLDDTSKKTRKAKGTGTRTPIDEAAVIKVLGDKELGYADIAKGLGKNPQTVKKWLDNNKKFSKRSEDPKNPRSKVFYKVN